MSTPSIHIKFPAQPTAKTMADQVTPKQLIAIRAIARAIPLDADEECQGVLKCKPEELSRAAASAFIEFLKQRSVEVRNARLRKESAA